MYQAPTVTLNARVAPMPSGSAGVFTTVSTMRQMVNMSKRDPRIIQASTSIIWTAPERDELSEVQALYEWVRDGVRYVRDVHAMETLSDPAITLARRLGDCDDQSALLASMLESVGYPTRFVMGAFAAPGVWDHVWLQVFAAGEWIDIDPTEHQYLGWAPPDPFTVWVES